MQSRVAGSGLVVSALWSGEGSRLGVVRDNCVLVVAVPAWSDVREVSCGLTNSSLATPRPPYNDICQADTWLWFSPGRSASWLAFIKLRPRPEDNPAALPAAALDVADLSSEAGGVTEVELGGEERWVVGMMVSCVHLLVFQSRMVPHSSLLGQLHHLKCQSGLR